MKASAFRRWPVTLGLIALVQTTRWTGGHDCIYLYVNFQVKVFYMWYNPYCIIESFICTIGSILVKLRAVGLYINISNSIESKVLDFEEDF